MKIFLSDITYELVINLAVFIISSLGTYIIIKRKELFLRIQSFIRYNKDIRISVAYLYRIKINNQYLLIKGNNISQYQPVGGVYKTYDSFNSLATILGISSDDNGRFYEKQDLRVIIKGKKLLKFIDWFKSYKNRETNTYRELNEELIEKGVLNRKDFFNLEFEFIKRYRSKIKHSQHFGMDEFHIFDIYEVNLDGNSEDKIKESVKKNDYLVLVSGDEIAKECFEIKGKSTKIGEHSKEILGGT